MTWEERQARRRAYWRKYYAKNRERISARRREYRKKNQEANYVKEREWRKAYHQRNKERLNAYRLELAHKNPEKYKEAVRRSRSLEKVKRISRAELDAILNSEGDTYEPRGLFVVEEDVDGRMICTAVNNTNGDAVTEEFASRQPAVRWLHGYTVHNLYGERLNGEARDDG